MTEEENMETARQNVVQEHLERNYIEGIPYSEEKSEFEWVLPHSQVIPSDRATTKVRIVVNTSATTKEVLTQRFYHVASYKVTSLPW